MIEDFSGALTYDDILYKFTIPQLFVMRMDKPSVETDDEDEKGKINSAEELMGFINNRKNR